MNRMLRDMLISAIAFGALAITGMMAYDRYAEWTRPRSTAYLAAARHCAVFEDSTGYKRQTLYLDCLGKLEEDFGK